LIAVSISNHSTRMKHADDFPKYLHTRGSASQTSRNSAHSWLHMA
jgi:hypothetical protein